MDGESALKKVMETEAGRKVWGYLNNKDLTNCRLVSKGWKESVEKRGVCSSSFTCTAPVNIAVIKYWGKRDTKLILPINSSLSGTLHQDDLRSQTTVQAFRNLKEDEFYLNGKREAVTGRMQSCLRLVREAAATMDNGECYIQKNAWKNYKVKIVSENNFPTAAGLASSASGLCCLVFALSRLYCLPDDRVMLSTIARQGSGSACRSMYGGFSKWMKGEDPTGADSVALPVVDEKHWEDMRVLILVANDQKKAVGSTEGMQKSLEGVAGEKLKRRSDITVPRRMEKIEKAIHAHDFDTFARISMKDSDDFHEVCRVTEPSLHYMNDTSRLIVRMVNCINKAEEKRRAGYTFDAGPNGVLYLLEPHFRLFLSASLFCFPNTEKNANYLRNAASVLSADSALVQGGEEEAQEKELLALFPEGVVSELKEIRKEVVGGGCFLKYILATRIGPGPIVVSSSC